jgi:hypothetical protein
MFHYKKQLHEVHTHFFLVPSQRCIEQQTTKVKQQRKKRKELTSTIWEKIESFTLTIIIE